MPPNPGHHVPDALTDSLFPREPLDAADARGASSSASDTLTIDLPGNLPPLRLAVSAAPVPPAECEAWLRLSMTLGIGPVTVLRLLAVFGSPAAVFADPARLKASLAPRLADALLATDDERETRMRRCLEWVADQDGRTPGSRHLIPLNDPRYPRQLLALSDPPPLLHVLGDPAHLSRPSLAIVGSRHATRAGALRAEGFSQALAEAGWTVVSGLAAGIDACAHRGALASGHEASTVAVIGNGLDRLYPASNRTLGERIAADGAIVSEHPPGTLPLRAHFPRRNRLIAALAHGVIVVEAARQSGSLITARLAADLGREVFAVPGSVDAPLAKGCHALIKQGAKLVECVDDILDELPTGLRRQVEGVAAVTPPGKPFETSHEDIDDDPDGTADDSDADPARLLETMGWDPADIESLARANVLPPAQLAAALLLLELDGKVERLADGRYRRMPQAAGK